MVEEEENYYVESVGGVMKILHQLPLLICHLFLFICHLHLYQMLRVCMCKLRTCHMLMFHNLLL